MKAISKKQVSSRQHNVTTLAGFLNKGKNGAENIHNINCDDHLDSIIEEFTIRNNHASSNGKAEVFSSQHIAQRMILNYIEVLRSGVKSLSGTFTQDEIGMLLNMNPSPIWQKKSFSRLRDMFIDAYNIEFDDDLLKQPALLSMLDKLDFITVTENFALMDLCERFWRNKNTDSIDETFEKMGLDFY